MATQVEQYVYEYLYNCEGSFGGRLYSWKRIDANNYELDWALGKYSYGVKASFEKYAVQLLKKYTEVRILVNGNKMLVSNHELTLPEPEPEPPEPKPPVFVPCPTCSGSGIILAICPTCGENTLDKECPTCAGSGKVLKAQ